ncbi:MAG: alcohol dehydrogenase catalytic domain-containing protein, partial [Planctomycetota bacterium]
MKACVLAAPGPVEKGPLALRDVPDPVPGDADLLIRVRACGVCRTDLHVVEGELPVRRPGVIPGHQVVGEVVARGPGVRCFAAGDRVGVAWLHRTCGRCRFCAGGRENLCEAPQFTGWSVDG